MQKKQDTGIWERLCQRRILVLGPDSDMKQKFLQELGNRGAEISESAEDMSPEDYVILFGSADRTLQAGRYPEARGEQDFELGAGSIRGENKDGGGILGESKNGGCRQETEGWETFSSLTRVLRQIQTVRPESVLFVSRADVYGKLFGEFHLVKEDELGYVCHTDMRSQEAVRLRMLEHLCCRMAREDGIAVKIARFPKVETGKKPERDSEAETGKTERQGIREKKHPETGRTRTVELAARILLDGTAGEAYNAEGALQTAPDTTALEPIRIVMDAGKAGKLE